MKREVWVEKVIPAFIFFSLWLDGWIFPLILLPIVYVLLVEKRSLSWLGFSRHGLRFSMVIGVLIVFVLGGIYYPIFLYYLPYMLQQETVGLYEVFLNVVHYPVYEEIAYRSFALTHFAELDRPFSTRNILVNLFQSLLFLVIHKHHFSVPLVLIPVFLLGFLNGFLFLRTRNIYGCIVSHSALNGFGLLLLRYL